MSIDQAFSRASYPSLDDSDRDRVFSAARVQGHAAGYAAGYAAGMNAAAGETEAMQARIATAGETQSAAMAADFALTHAALTTAAAALESAEVPLLSSVDAALAAAAFELAEAIVGCELADGEAGARAAVQRAMAATPGHPVRRVRLHPLDLGVIEASSDHTAHVQFLADDSLERGDAIAELDDGIVDARVSSSLRRARSAMLGDSE